MFHDIHLSGFHGVTHKQRRNADNMVADEASVAALTERHDLNFNIPGWGQYGNETKIVWMTRKWELLDAGTITIPTGPWSRGTHPENNVKIAWGFLERKPGHGGPFTLLRLGFHFPAHLYKSRQQAANLDAFRSQGEQILRLQSRLGPDETTESGDGNRDFRLSKNRKLMQHGLAGTHMNVRVPPGRTIRGALGRRIDVYATTAPQASNLSMLPWLDGYDHRGIRRTSHTSR